MNRILPRRIDPYEDDGINVVRINGIELLLKWQWNTWKEKVRF